MHPKETTMADLSKLTGGEPTFPCESCDKPKSRVWVPLEGGNMTMGWACHWCLDPRTIALRGRLLEADAVTHRPSRLAQEYTACGEKMTTATHLQLGDGETCERCTHVVAQVAAALRGEPSWAQKA